MSPAPAASRRAKARPSREASPDADALTKIAVDAALERKAEDLKVLDLGAISDFTDRFLICSGTNERQVQAIADAVVEKLRAAGLRPLHVEGEGGGNWVLVDYGGEMVVHVFLDETRRYYDLERLWSDAPDSTARFVAVDGEPGASETP